MEDSDSDEELFCAVLILAKNLDNDVYPERGACGFVIFSKIEKRRVTTII